MQARHQNRIIYFKELSTTSKNYFIPYIQQWHPVEKGTKVLEIGCGEGGNLLPFAEMGCNTVGIDIAASRIKEAKNSFTQPMPKVHLLHKISFYWIKWNGVSISSSAMMCLNIFLKKSYF